MNRRQTAMIAVIAIILVLVLPLISQGVGIYLDSLDRGGSTIAESGEESDKVVVVDDTPSFMPDLFWWIVWVSLGSLLLSIFGLIGGESDTLPGWMNFFRPLFELGIVGLAIAIIWLICEIFRLLG